MENHHENYIKILSREKNYESKDLVNKPSPKNKVIKQQVSGIQNKELYSFETKEEQKME